MNTTELRAIVAQIIPDWWVTINEEYMLNVQADDIERFGGFAYVEEFARANVSYAKFGRDVTYTHDVYFCVLGEFDTTAEQREAIRQQRIMPRVRAVEDKLHQMFGIDEFKEDYEPRGFDAHEILVHIQFNAKDKRC